MILWTIRHTKPYNPNDVCYGRLDFDISSTFENEAELAINALLKENPKPKKIFSSPLIRAYKLAEKVSNKLKIPIEKKEAIIEINFGLWEGEKLDKVPHFEMLAWKSNLRGFRFPNGESFYDVDKRVEVFLDSLEENNEYLFVTHAGVIAALQHFACGLPDSDFVEGKFSYTMINRFDLKRNNEGHFRGTFTKIHDGIQMSPLKI